MRLGRLKKRADFVALGRTRTRTASAGMVVQARPMPDRQAGGEQGPDMRVGFTASKKVGNAVRRNRAKRRLRALADTVLRERAEPGHDFVLIARGATVDRPFSDLTDDLIHSLKRLKLLRQGAV